MLRAQRGTGMKRRRKGRGRDEEGSLVAETGGRQGGRGRRSKRENSSRQSAKLKEQMGTSQYHDHVHGLVEAHMRKAAQLRNFKQEYHRKHGTEPCFDDMPLRFREVRVTFLILHSFSLDGGLPACACKAASGDLTVVVSLLLSSSRLSTFTSGTRSASLNECNTLLTKCQKGRKLPLDILPFSLYCQLFSCRVFYFENLAHRALVISAIGSFVKECNPERRKRCASNHTHAQFALCISEHRRTFIHRSTVRVMEMSTEALRADADAIVGDHGEGDGAGDELCEHAKALGDGLFHAVAAAVAVTGSTPRSSCFVCLRCGTSLAGKASASAHCAARGPEHALALHVPSPQLANWVAALWCSRCSAYLQSSEPQSLLRGARSLANDRFGGLSRSISDAEPMPLYEPSIHEALSFPTDRSPQPPAQPRGMVNLGSSCFMSSILQALASLPPLRAYFLGGRHQRDRCKRGQGHGKCLACELDTVFQQLAAAAHPENHAAPAQQHSHSLSASSAHYHVNSVSAARSNGASLAADSNGHYLNGAQSNGNAFANAAIAGNEALESTVQNLPPLLPTGLLYSTFLRAMDGGMSSAHQDAHELLMTLCRALHEDHTEGAPPPSPRALSVCECPVHSTLGGWIRSDVHCIGCGNVSSSPEPFLCLSVDVIAGGTTTLPMLLSRWANAERLAQSPCDTCKGQREKSQVVTFAPPVLVLHLMRFQHNTLDGSDGSKLNADVLCPIRGLDVREITSHGVAGCSNPLLYDLVAFVDHVGEEAVGGHYVAYARRGSTDIWDKCDDWYVSQVGEEEVLHAARNAYLLFYADRRLVEPAGELTEHAEDDLSQLLAQALAASSSAE